MVIAKKLAGVAATVESAAIAVGICGFVVTACGAQSDERRQLAHDRTVEFSGRSWQVRWNAVRRGPGPNYFSDAPANVRVDSAGRLHLRLTHANGRWYSAEVISRKSFGYGRYSFEVDSPIHNLDPHVVVGLFTWNTDPVDHDREIDIEFSRFGKEEGRVNGDFVVQPYNVRRNLQKIVQPAVSPSTHSFDWQPRSVTFSSSSAAPSPWR